MGSKTGINWADATVNFWQGCIKVSEGCKYCYMYRGAARWGKDGSDVRKTNISTIRKILKDLEGTTSRIFTCSLSDFFIPAADEWRAEAWEIIRNSPHTFMILTKLPERIKDHLPADWGKGYPNVWLGVSAENQARYDERIELLLNVPARIRFLSLEPLLGPIELGLDKKMAFANSKYSFESNLYLSDLIDWVIIGGESGNETGKYLYRPCNFSWIDDLLDQCLNSEVALWVKQYGTYLAKLIHLPGAGENDGSYPMDLPEAGKKCEGCHSKRQGIVQCFLHDNGTDIPDEILCSDCAAGEGYCYQCGRYSAGTTGFDFVHQGICDSCYQENSLEDDCNY
jgi:protein gp37